MNKKKQLIIDSSKGGNGDIWMRLISFYSMAGLLSNYEIRLLIPAFFKNLAQYTFGDRIFFIDETEADTVQLNYTNLGIIDLFKDVVRGKRYISPYQRSVIHDKKKKELKDVINIALFTVADVFGFVQIPAWKWINAYQGYLDVIGIKKLRKVTYADYISQLQLDYEVINKKLALQIPISPELQFPADLNENIIVFPTGTSRQFVPVWWAERYMPDAYYAFFYKDDEANIFKAAGLKVLSFYKEPGDIIALSKMSKWTVSTDSFPSHLLQYASSTCSITITEVLKSRIISPVFKGKVINAQVECHPCLHLARKIHPFCAAGYSECQNWRSSMYTNDLLSSIS